MHIRCPHCHGPLEIVEDEGLKEVTCSSCGSSFSLVGNDSTTSYRAKSRRIAHFELIDQLGLGAFGSVWKAKDTQLDRTVAIKIPRVGQLDSEEVEMFLREARAAAQLKHPNIVSVHEVGRADGQLYIVSDYVQGANLREWLSGRRPTFQEAAELCATLATALHHAHEKGVVHRDVKPGNVMMDDRGEPHLMDFGLAKREVGEITMTMDGRVLGTPAYMSPEQAAGRSHLVDRRADVYAVGVILFELLTGELPFRGDKEMLLLQIRNDEPPNPRRLNHRIPRDLETICLKCLRKEPAHRFATASDLSADLRRWLCGEPIKARPVSSLEKSIRWCRRRPALIRSSIAILTCISIAAAMVQWQRRENVQRIVESRVDTVLLSPPEALPFTLAQLLPHGRQLTPRLTSVRDDASRPMRQRLHAALSLAHLGEVDLEFLIHAIADAHPDECGNIATALKLAKAPSIQRIRQQARIAELAKDWRQKSRLSIVAMYLGEESLAADMLQINNRPDPIQRTMFIEHFATWHGKLDELAQLSAHVGDEALRSGIAMAVGSVADIEDDAINAWHPVLSNWFAMHRDAVTHSAAGWALRRWNQIEPRARLESQKAMWQINSVGMTMIYIPAGKFVRPHFNDNTHVELSRGFSISDREVTWELLRKCVQDPDYLAELKPVDGRLRGITDPSGISYETKVSAQCPVQMPSWVDAVLFCNWLSHRDGIRAYYERSNPIDELPAKTMSDWRVVAEADGYRLPTTVEWEYACRAGTTTRFSCGDDELALRRYALFTNNHAEAAGNRLPNAWGLFDMHGNIREMCQTCRIGDSQSVVDPEPMVGSLCHRGGAYVDSTDVLASAYENAARPDGGDMYLGFRVARNAR